MPSGTVGPVVLGGRNCEDCQSLSHSCRHTYNPPEPNEKLFGFDMCQKCHTSTPADMHQWFIMYCHLLPQQIANYSKDRLLLCRLKNNVCQILPVAQIILMHALSGIIFENYLLNTPSCVALERGNCCSETQNLAKKD